MVRTMRRASALSFGVCLILGLAGCGGGGGGGSEPPAAGAPGQPPVTPPSPPPSPPPPGQIGSVNWLQPSVRFERDVFAAGVASSQTASLAMQAPGVGYWFRYTYDDGQYTVNYRFRSADDGIDFDVRPVLFPTRPAGVYTDTLSVRVCYDEACAREVSGSPFQLPLRLDVGYFAKAEEGLTPLVPTQTSVLNHHVVGAAYSRALDAVITVAALPAPTLRLHDLGTGGIRSVPLGAAPTSLSLDASGLQAAVGHDAAVSLVDLRADAVSPVRRFDVPMPVGNVVLAGTRVVAIGADPFSWNPIYWVDTLVGTATRAGSFVQVYGRGDALLHPAGDRLYLADRGLSPDEVWRMDLVATAANAELRDSRYHGEHPFCSRVAASPDGRRLYTGCGVVLNTAPLLADDLVYAGRMALSTPPPASPGRFVAAALSVAPDGAAVALLEENNYHCEPRIEQLGDCHTRLAVYDSGTLTRRSLAGLAPYQRGTDRLQQWGRFLMHRADGSLIVLTEVRTLSEPSPTWLLHRVAP